MNGATEDRSWQSSVLKAAIFAIAFVVFATIGAFVLIDRMDASDQRLMGTVLARHGSTCQRTVIDHGTGAIKSVEHFSCGESAKTVSPPVEPAAPRYSSGGRVDAIRDSFRNR